MVRFGLRNRAIPLRYLIRLKKSELYPLILKPGDNLRFSLLVNDNNGQTRVGYLHWGDGIGDSKDPVALRHPVAGALKQ